MAADNFDIIFSHVWEKSDYWSIQKISNYKAYTMSNVINNIAFEITIYNSLTKSPCHNALKPSFIRPLGIQSFSKKVLWFESYMRYQLLLAFIRSTKKVPRLPLSSFPYYQFLY